MPTVANQRIPAKEKKALQEMLDQADAARQSLEHTVALLQQRKYHDALAACETTNNQLDELWGSLSTHTKAPKL